MKRKELKEKLTYRFRTKTGDYRLLDVTANLAGNEILFVSRDITERARIQKELKQAKMTIEYSSEEVFWVDEEANIIYANNKASELLGYCKEELLTKTIYDINKNFTHEQWRKHWCNIKKNGSILMESSEWKKNGEEFPTEVSYNYIELGNQSLSCAFGHDITERLEARRQEECYTNNMNHLSKSALRFLDCSTLEEFFSAVLQQTRPLVGGAFLAAMLYEQEKDSVRITAFDKGTTNIANIVKLLGRDLIGLEVKLTEGVKKELLAGKLMS